MLWVLAPLVAIAAPVLPEVVVQAGHDAVAAALSADGRWLVTAGGSSAKIWDVRSGLLLRSIPGHATTIAALALSPDGSLVATATSRESADPGVTRVFATDTGHELFSLAEAPLRLVFLPDGKRLAVGLGRATKIVDDKGQDLFVCLGGHPTVAARDDLLITVDETRVRSCRLDGTGAAAKWEGADDALLGALHDPSTGVVAAWSEHAVFLWSPGDASPRKVDVTAAGDLAGVVAIGAGMLAAAGAAQLLHIDTVTGSIGETLSANAAGALIGVEGSTIIVAGPKGQLTMLSARTGQPERRLEPKVSTASEASIASDGRSMLTSNGQLWDLALGKVVRAVRGGAHVSFLAGDHRYVVADDKGASVVDLASGRELWRLDRPVSALAVTQDRTRIALVADGKTLRARLIVLDATTLLPAGIVPDQPDFASIIDSIALSPNGSLLAFGTVYVGLGGTHIIDLAKGTLWPDPVTTSFFSTRSISFSASGDLVTAAGYGTVPDVARVRRAGNSVPRRGDHGHRSFVHAVAFSPHEETGLVSGGDDGVVRFTDAITGNLEGAVTLSAAVTALAVDPRGGRVVASTEDGAVHLIDVAKHKLIATMLAVGADDFVTVLPDGAYRASRGALRSVAFRVGREVYPFDQFDLRLNRPHEVLTALGVADHRTISLYRAAFNKRLEKAGIKDAGEGSSVPPVARFAAEVPTHTADRKLTLEIEGDGAGNRLEHVNVFVNDVAVAGRRGIAPTPAGAMSARFSVPILLSAGRNKVQISVVNALGVESLRETRAVDFTGPAPPPRTFVLAIGVSEYREHPLHYAVKDARDVVGAVKTDASLTRVLADKEVSRESIAAARQWLATSDVDDEIIVFVSGHGLLDAQLDYWFGTWDVDFNDPGRRGIAYDDVEGLVDGIPARKKLLLMDTCNSGELDPKERAMAAALPDAAGPILAGAKGFSRSLPVFVDDTAMAELLRELFSDLRRGSGAVVISSAGGLQSAMEASSLQNGLFTYALLNGIRSGDADRDKDGRIMTAELRDYVVTKVIELSAGAQRPTARREQVEFDFPWPAAAAR